MTKYKIIAVDGTETEHEIEWPKEPGYRNIAALVNPIIGLPLEHVSVLYNDKPADMFVNEEGLLTGLPRNEKATAIYRAATLKRHPKADPEKFPFIVGPAVLFEQRVWF